MSKAYFEDFVVGSVKTFGSYLVTREEVIAFASEFDAQPFHLDDEAGRESMMGGLCASGWHTSCIMMRLLVDGLLRDSSSMGAPGIEEMKWPRPVFPGDRLSLRSTVLDKRRSKSRPSMGFVRLLVEILNQNGERVLMLTTPLMMGARSDSEPAGTHPEASERA